MKIEFKNNILIAHLSGELDHHIADEIRREISKYLNRNRVSILIFDFTNVSFMDSSGIGLIIGRYKEMGQANVYCVGLSNNVEKIFKLSGLLKIIKTYSSVDECLKELEKMEG